ncbi:hypothetical protein [Variovorax sp. YR752]|uniref:hypothetical protein n=1 Tax=Variovorax sp. YR752 TaxID=1884383 RepID=UPI003137753A
MTASHPDTIELEAPTALNVLNVRVSVTADGTPVCVPELLDVVGSDVLIAYQLDANDWIFPSQRAVVVEDGGSQFPFPSWTVNRKLALLFDCNTSPGYFHYTVYVKHVTTGEVRSVDPSIRNET